MHQPSSAARIPAWWRQPGSEDGDGEDWHRTERTIAVIRLIALGWGITQVLGNPALPYPPGLRITASLMLAMSVLGTLLILLASRRYAGPEPLLAVMGLIMDATVALSILWIFGFDRLSTMWAILVIVALEGAARFGVAGAVVTSVGLAAAYSIHQIWVSGHYGFPLEWEGVSFRMGIVLVAALVAGSVARSLGRQRLATERATRRFRHLVEGLDAVVWEADPATGDLLYVNPAGTALLGYADEHWESNPAYFSAHIHPDDAERVRRQTRAATEAGADHELEYRLLGATGRTIWVHDSVRVERADGRPVRLRGVMVDITARKRAEERLRANERRLEEAQGIAHVGSWSWDVKADRVEWSEELYSIYGKDHHAFGGRFADFVAVVHPDDREQVAAAIAHARHTGRSFKFEHRIRRADGALRLVLCRGQVSIGGDGQSLILSGTGQDVTERRQREAALHEAEERFRHAFDHAPNGMALVATDGRHLRVNAALCRITGYGEAELLAKTASELLSPEGPAEDATDGFERLVAGQSPSLGTECRFQRADGRLIWVQIGVSKVCDTEGSVYLVMQVQDITERKLADRLGHLLGDVSVAVSEAPDLPAALGAVVEQVCEATGWDLGEAWVPALDGTVLELCCATPDPSGQLDAFRRASRDVSFAPGVGLPGRVWASRQPAWIAELAPDDNFPRAQVAAAAGLDGTGHGRVRTRGHHRRLR